MLILIIRWFRNSLINCHIPVLTYICLFLFCFFVFSCLKMPLFCTNRDVVLASLERYDSDQRCYILALRSTEHPMIQQAHNKSNVVRYSMSNITSIIIN